MMSAQSDLTTGIATAAHSPLRSPTVFWLLIAFAVCVSLLLRSVALNNTTVLDDHDSVFYVQSIEAYASWQWSQINALNSDSTPVYPFLASVLTPIVDDAERAGRWVSLLSSTLLVLIVALLGARLHSQTAGVVAALILACTPLEVSLSIAVLTEILYQALLYAGIYITLRVLEARQFTLASASLAATLYGLSFLTKTEGVLFIALCPMIVVAIQISRRWASTAGDSGKLVPVGWIATFMLIFAVMATLQIVHITQKMGSPALNGRVAWQSLAALMPDRPLDAAMYGLDLDDATTNLIYARQNHQEAVDRLSGESANEALSTPLVERLKLSLKNVDTIYRYILTDILSPVGVFFLFAGALFVLVQGTVTSLIFYLFMLAAVLIAPVLHTSVIPRQMAQAIPVFSILQAVAIVELARWVVKRYRHRILFTLTVMAAVGVLIAGQAVPIYKSLNPPTFNGDYDPAVLAEPASMLRERPAVERMAARKGYLAYMAGIDYIPVPFTDLEGLVSYLRLNESEFVYIDFKLLELYPFLASFTTSEYEQYFTERWSHSPDGQLRSALYQLTSE